MRVSPPPFSLREPERFDACSKALEPAVWRLLERACEAGWTRAEAILVASTLLMRFAGELPPSAFAEAPRSSEKGTTPASPG